MRVKQYGRIRNFFNKICNKYHLGKPTAEPVILENPAEKEKVKNERYI